MAVVFIFLDGVGLGNNNPEENPWAKVKENSLIATLDQAPTWPGAVWKPLDANLGIEGLPQSATGTTALLTGQNAPKILGLHKSGFPNDALQSIINEHSIYIQAKNLGINATFANAYNEAYFERPLNRQSVTTHAVRAANLPFRMMDKYRNGRAVFHDLTGELIRIQGNNDKLTPPKESKALATKRYLRDHDTFVAKMKEYNLPVIDPSEAGLRIANIAKDYDLVVFEYVKTDMAGHSQNNDWAGSVVNEVMTFVTKILNNLDLTTDTLVIGSDHGNSEDLTVKTHTRNPVPAVAVGKNAEKIISDCVSINDLTPAIINVCN